MKPWRWIAALVCLVAFGGCRSSGDQELLERELRFYEDKVDELNAVVREYEDRIESCQRENESILKETEGEGKPRRGRGSDVPRARSSNGVGDDEPFTPPDVSLPPGAMEPSREQALPFDGPPAISPPDVDRGGATDSSGDPSDRLRSPAPPARLELPDPAAGDEDGRPADLDSSGASAAVSKITLNRQLTGGHNVDNRPGDEGVLVVVEPRDAADELVEAPAEISVVVLDPSQTGSAARVARWNFTAADAAKHLERTPLGAGFHFALRWPHSPPVNRSLKLFVRYVTADGRKLTVEKEIDVDPPGAKAQGNLTQDEEPDLLPTQYESLAAPSDNEAPADPRDRASLSSAPDWSPYR